MNNIIPAHFFNSIFVYVAQIFPNSSVFIFSIEIKQLKPIPYVTIGTPAPELLCRVLVGAEMSQSCLSLLILGVYPELLYCCHWLSRSHFPLLTLP